MKKECPYIVLPTKERSILCFSPRYPGELKMFGEFDNSYEDECRFQHLYILSDEEPKEGDWCIAKKKYGPMKYGNVNKEMIPAPHDCNRIIATTNPELLEKWASTPYGTYKVEDGITQISKSDIEYIIELHNQQQKESEPNKMTAEQYLNMHGMEEKYGIIEISFKGMVAHLKSFSHWDVCENNSERKFTLEDMKKCYNQSRFDGNPMARVLHPEIKDYNSFEDYIQSLTKEQSKIDTIMVEYDHPHDKVSIDWENKTMTLFPKLTDGHITIIKD